MNRAENGINLHRFCEGYGLRVRPYHESRTPRPANTIYGGRYLKRLMRKDIDRAGLVLRCIQSSNPTCFEDVTIFATWCFVGAHFAQCQPAVAIEAFRRIDLAEIRQRAQRLAVGESGRMAKTATTISILLAQAIIHEDKAA